MTEADWASCTNPHQMLAFLDDVASERKLRLLACACVRQVWHLLEDERSRAAIDAVERIADGRLDRDVLPTAYAEAGDAANRLNYAHPHILRPVCAALAARYAAADAVIAAVRDSMTMARAAGSDAASQCLLARDLFGNPFRQVFLQPAWLAWNAGTVVKMARSIYDDRRFRDLPVLGDALEDAGCDYAALLAHCREPGEHALGCWVVDAILGKA